MPTSLGTSTLGVVVGAAVVAGGAVVAAGAAVETVVGVGAGWAAMPAGSLQPRVANPRMIRAAGRKRRLRRGGGWWCLGVVE
jgi:hypothetical protein